MTNDHAVSSPVISVILPVYNGEEFLQDAIDSILNQSFLDFELVIIDDGSKDRSLEIINSYTDPRIKLVQNVSNLGLVGALNSGISVAKGRYLARQDADDLSHKDRLKLQYLSMEELGADICGTAWAQMNPDGSILSVKEIPLSEDTIFACLATTVPFPHGSVMMRSSFIKKHQLKYETIQIAEDYYLWIRFAQFGGLFSNINKCLYFYRLHPKSLSSIKKNLYGHSAKQIRRIFTKQNVLRSTKVLEKLSKNSDVINTLNYRETIYAAMLAYRLPFSKDSALKFLRIFFQAKMKLKLHILYTITKS